MTIKEVEKIVELKKANIRYYEEEGLFTPKRNVQNNYREYEAEDVEILKKIKCLRVLGVPVQDIKKLQRGQISLPALMRKQKESLENDAREIRRLKDLCSQLEECALSFDDLDTSVVNMHSTFLVMRGKKMMELDKIFLLEKYYNLILKAWTVLVIAIVPLQFAVRFVMDTELPRWINVPYFSTAILTSVVVLFLQYRISHYKHMQQS